MTDRGKLPFVLVDVFASEPLTGNPLAVVADADGLDAGLMGRIAREMNQSETTFVLAPSRPGAHWRLRSFTPSGAEVVGVGHNALGAWWWLAATGRLALSPAGGRFVQEIGDRLLPVEVKASDGVARSITMTQAAPVFGQIHPDIAALAEALGLGLDDLDVEELFAQVVSTGAAHLLVPARDRAAVQRAVPDAARLLGELQRVEAQGCYLFCLDPVDQAATAHARFFNPTVGIAEDPATGSAAGPLACLLVAEGRAVRGAKLLVEQGHAVGRPSLLQVQVRPNDVRLTGTATISAEGNLWL